MELPMSTMTICNRVKESLPNLLLMCFFEKSISPISSPATKPPMCIKLSTHGVRPMRRFTMVMKTSPTMPDSRTLPRARWLSMMSAQVAPTRPNTEAEAPSETTPGSRTTDTMVPHSPERMYRLATRHQPNRRSRGKPRLSTASMLKRRWKRPTCSQLHATMRHHSPRPKMPASSFAPMLFITCTRGPNSGLLSHDLPSS
mmetsp:Transcript_15314/g.48590  ORF Transcript_15314/g.48590 Transcript_15314/m.48590 type:complete len:200 (+) Transcript_15314:995-1594(+)